jgi:phenylacetate-CoA ligase
MEHFDDVVTVNDVSKKEVLTFLDNDKDPSHLYKNKYYVLHTSGSSGRIGVFVYSQKDWDRYFPNISRVFNFKFRKTKSVFFGAVNGHFTGVSFITWCGKGVPGMFCQPLILDITRPLDEHIKKLNEFQPDILGGYFTGLKILADQQKKGLLSIKPKIVVNSGEGIITKDKNYIEEAFNVPLTNNYGLAECPVLGAGKNDYDGIYMMDDLCYLEIKKDHALITNLFNKTQPLIRYKIHDVFTIKEDETKRLPFTLVNDIVGRTEAMIWFENKDGTMDFIHPIVIAEFYVKGLEKLQFVIKDKKSFEFLAVISESNKEEVITKIKQELDTILADKNFTNVTYEIKVVDDLTVDKKTGKFQLIVTSN